MSSRQGPGAAAHVPVMLKDVVDAMAHVPPGLVIDATVGAGGHACGILHAAPQVTLLGLDRDDEALHRAGDALAAFGDRAVIRRARFDELAEVLADLGHERVSGVLFDLGVSSMQLDQPERGFSFHDDGPLDMRMDRRQPTTAAEIVNGYPEDRLAKAFADLGDERFARRVAHAVVAARPVNTTTELAEIVRQAIPAATRRQGPHPARRVFQALRLEVNAELDVLTGALDQAIDLLAPGGRIAVLSYHSGEDRIVKRRLTLAATGGCTCPPALPCVCGAEPTVRLVWRGARKPSDAEVTANPRARSARLRVAERLAA